MNSQLTVAAPWSLTHYMPLNGFHPLYRALFESKPDWVRLSAWDNIELSQKLRGDASFRHDILQEVRRDTEALKLHTTRIEKEYFAHLWAPNRTLTRLLPGDIEFHHTAPFPSLERPFVFHCESFAPVFFPFAHQGTGSLASSEGLRAHYRAIFEHPLCLGIFSHLPQTLEDLSRFFASPIIDDRLCDSRIGLHGSEGATTHIDKGPLSAPVFLFINSANQNRGNFFLRGGHLALRYWQLAYPEPGAGRLIMRCARPIDAMLAEHGVDPDWLRRHERRSVIWIEDYLSAAELDALMQAAHFFLLPSASLHSVSIMQAMAAGAVPVVSDTMGTDRYVRDAVDGIVLQGVYASNWQRDAETGVMIDHYKRNPELEASLVQQLGAHLGELLAHPDRYVALQSGALSKAGEAFSGSRFSQDFWQQVQQRYQALPEPLRKREVSGHKWPELVHCLVEQADWPRIFTSAPQPVARLHTGHGRVTELGGCFIALPGDCSVALHEWSPVAEYVDVSAPPLIFAVDIKGLGGRYLDCQNSGSAGSVTHRFVEFIAERLMPHPQLYSVAAGFLKFLRRMHGAVRRRLPAKTVVAKPIVIPTDIELVMQGVKGLNVLRFGHMFYAIPQGAGEFSQARAEAGEYDPCVSGTSLKDVLRRVENLQERSTEDVELVEQGVRGFNLIRCGSVFYAIPQSEGAFDLARIHAGQYSRMHSGPSAEAVRDVILGSAS